MIQLRDYQTDIAAKACDLLKQYGIAYLSMQVRCGKTLTALETAKLYGAQRVLFLTKKKAIGSIMEDFSKGGYQYFCHVTNYEQVENIGELGYDLIICDEAHGLGQFPKPAKRTKLLKQLCAGKPIIFLSGTPTPESWSQIYHQLYISDRSPFDHINFYKWANEYVNKKKRYFYNREVIDYSGGNYDLIWPMISHLFLSYSQEEAGFIQDVQEEVLRVKMQEGTYYLANKLLKDRVAIGKDGAEILADTEVKLQQKLHQVFSGTVLAEDGAGRVFDASKAKYIRDYIWRGTPEWNGCPTRKVAIFYKFKAELDMLKGVFGHAITDSPEAFRDAGPETIFASQIQSGREGINLSTADCLVMLNIDFSSVSYQQARARIQSKDRTKECKLYWIFSEGGIEDKIYAAVQNKQDYTLRYFKKDFKISNNKKAA